MFLPSKGIGHVHLKDDIFDNKEPDISFIPKETIEKMKKEDGVMHMIFSYYVKVYMEKGKASLYYEPYYTPSRVKLFYLGDVDNAEEIKKYFLKRAGKKTIEKTGWQ